MQTSMNMLPMIAGHLGLEEELRHRIQIGRPRLIRRIQDAIADDWPSILLIDTGITAGAADVMGMNGGNQQNARGGGRQTKCEQSEH